MTETVRYTYLEAPNRLENSAWYDEKPSLFLAGGITDCADWQAWACIQLESFEIIVFNPRRRNFDVGDARASEAQIKWEHEHLHVADVILFWFAAETIQPIALYELGAWSMTTKPMAVGCHSMYKRTRDVVIQTRLARPDITVHPTLGKTISEAVRLCNG